MIIVTPPAGSVPEPRPQALITGDRAVVLVSDNGVTVTALVKAGVQIVTVSSSVYTELTSQLAQVTTDVDSATGYIKAALLPPYLSPAAITALNVLDNTGHINQAMLPSYLTPTSLTALISSQSATQWATDPDGTPVILAGSAATGSSATYTGGLTAATVTTGVLHGDLFTATQAAIQANEVASQLYDNQSVAPGSPATNKIVTYADSTGRLNVKDPTGATYLIPGKRIVNAWPTTGMVVGDEAILSSSGEHRIWLGAVKGWRLASPHEVSTMAERNALTNLYPGYKVYCDMGVAQDQIWDGQQWRGTKSFVVNGGNVRTEYGVNDTNLRRWNETAINDPGYAYTISGRVCMEVVLLANPGRPFVWVSMCDQVTGANNQVIASAWEDAHNLNNTVSCNTWNRFDLPVISPQPQTGNRLILVDWQCTANGSNANATPVWIWNDYMVHPA